ncbi:bacterial proteasome activator family protein [Granulicoccus phenolivorans]|uniref:bacterial proteasome activator family protein n=1 Tax=Granulicoccus phenolivorans TaxID=266854 RepID=UPI00041DA66F|nr:bacterial proteasome activator family protein [Granulicoccus phenolivorans]
MSETENEGPKILAGETEDGRTFVVSPQGMAIQPAPDPEGGASASSVADQVEEPAKVMRIGQMIRHLLDEVKSAPLDEPSRKRLREVYAASVEELKGGLSPELADELARITQPFEADATPTDAELRIAQAQLVGWLEGLFSGIQTALFAQQVAARTQLEQMRRALPQAPGAEPGPPGRPGSSGMYL